MGDRSAPTKKKDPLEARLAKLSPERQELVRRLAQQRGARASEPVRQAPVDVSEEAGELLVSERFEYDAQGLTSKHDISRFYDTVSRQLDGGPFGELALFLNYGYVPNDQPSDARLDLLEAPGGSGSGRPNVNINKNTVRLILELVGGAPVRSDHDVLDVGCGRGGTLWTLRTYFGIAEEAGSITGVDLAPQAVAFCQRRHAGERARFLVGDAESLPFADASFDVVTNVESSHCYRDIDAFYSEVARVLRPGGWFLYTDLLFSQRLADCESSLAARGFEQREVRDITSNVLLSCDETARRNAKAFSQSNDSGVMGRFLGTPDSDSYDSMKTGVRRYMLYRMIKREGGS